MADWAGIKKSINTDITGDPLNCIQYINSIESAGKDSYVLDKRNQNLWRELLANSLTAFKVFSIHTIIYERLSTADVDYMIANNPRLGTCLNEYYEEEIFNTGNIDNVMEDISLEKLNKVEPKFRSGLKRWMSGRLSTDDVPTYLAEHFGIEKLKEYDSIKDFCGTKEVLDLVFENLKLMNFLLFDETILSEVVNSGDLMVDLCERADTLEVVETSEVWMKQILESNVGLGKLVSNKCDFVLTKYSDFDAIIDNTIAINTVYANNTALSYVKRSSIGLAKMLMWRLGEQATSVSSMDDIVSNSDIVTKIAESNGTNADAMAILIDSGIGMKAVVGCSEIMDVAITDLKGNANGIAHALVTTDEGAAYLADSTSDVYKNTFGSSSIIKYLFSNDETGNAILSNSKYATAICSFTNGVNGFLDYSVFNTAKRLFDDNDSVKKIYINSRSMIQKIFAYDFWRKYLMSRPRTMKWVLNSPEAMKIIIQDSSKITELLEDTRMKQMVLSSPIACLYIMNYTTGTAALANASEYYDGFLVTSAMNDVVKDYTEKLKFILTNPNVVNNFLQTDESKIIGFLDLNSLYDNDAVCDVFSANTGTMTYILREFLQLSTSATGYTSYGAAVKDTNNVPKLIKSKIIMKLIAGSSAIMGEIAGNSTAMALYAESKLALKEFFTNDVSISALSASTTAITALKSSSLYKISETNDYSKIGDFRGCGMVYITIVSTYSNNMDIGFVVSADEDEVLKHIPTAVSTTNTSATYTTSNPVFFKKDLQIHELQKCASMTAGLSGTLGSMSGNNGTGTGTLTGTSFTTGTYGTVGNSGYISGVYLKAASISIPSTTISINSGASVTLNSMKNGNPYNKITARGIFIPLN